MYFRYVSMEYAFGKQLNTPKKIFPSNHAFTKLLFD